MPYGNLPRQTQYPAELEPLPLMLLDFGACRTRTINPSRIHFEDRRLPRDLNPAAASALPHICVVTALAEF